MPVLSGVSAEPLPALHARLPGETTFASTLALVYLITLTLSYAHFLALCLPMAWGSARLRWSGICHALRHDLAAVRWDSRIHFVLENFRAAKYCNCKSRVI